MDFKMHGQAPVFKRCCFCLPLRRGLIGWGYARLSLDILVIFYLTIVFIVLPFLRQSQVLGFIAVISFFIVDVAFTILLVFAGHKKNSKLLRISYIYSTSWVILVLTIGVYGVIRDINRIIHITWHYYRYRSFKLFIFELAINCAILFTIIFVQVYVILLIRSESLKLQNQRLEMQFVNNAPEAEARCISADQRCTDNEHTSASVHYTDNKHDTSSQFVNNAAEAEARCISADQRCTDDGHTSASVHYTDHKHDTSSQVVNNAAEAEARCVSADKGCTDNGHTFVYYTDDKYDNSVKIMGNGHDSSIQQEPTRYDNNHDKRVNKEVV